VYDVYIDLDVPERPGAKGGKTVTRHLLPVLLVDKPYAGGLFFEYLEWQFMAVESHRGKWCATLVDGRPLIYPAALLMEQYLTKVGRNFSQEIFHPDEICAQSFVLAVMQPDMKLLSAMQRRLATAG